jgi:hypothetical protein
MCLLFDEQFTLKISYKWAAKKINCNLDGILNECHARCCYGPSYWPGRVQSGKNNSCYFLRKNGCIFSPEDKPITCHIYPFMIRKNVMSLHFRVLSGCCKKTYKHGPMIIEAIETSLVHLFGKKQTERVIENTKHSKNSVLVVPKHVIKSLHDEELWALQNVLPQPRTKTKDI